MNISSIAASALWPRGPTPSQEPSAAHHAVAHGVQAAAKAEEARERPVGLSRPAADRSTDREDRPGAETSRSGEVLDRQEQEALRKLRQRDREVRAEEAAKLAAAGAHAAGAASYSYEVGPDGRTYAVGGEVPIDTSPASSPEATMRKAQQLQVAAVASSDPTGEARAVAAAAQALAAEARREIAEQRREELREAAGATGRVDGPDGRLEGLGASSDVPPDGEPAPGPGAPGGAAAAAARAYRKVAGGPQDARMPCPACNGFH